MATHDPLDRDRRDPALADTTPDEAHRRAAFGRRPGDVPVLPERRRSVLPWVVGALLLLALIPLLGRLRGPAESDAPSQAAAYPTDSAAVAGGAATVASAGEVERGGGAGAVQRFTGWANEGGNQALPLESEENHPYTSQGIRLLADALDEATRTAGLTNAGQRVSEIRAQAGRLQASSDIDEHAEHAHAAFVSAARLIGELHDRDHPGASNGGELMSLARAIEAGKPLSPQGERVRRFFRKAAEALR